MRGTQTDSVRHGLSVKPSDGCRPRSAAHQARCAGRCREHEGPAEAQPEDPQARGTAAALFGLLTSDLAAVLTFQPNRTARTAPPPHRHRTTHPPRGKPPVAPLLSLSLCRREIRTEPLAHHRRPTHAAGCAGAAMDRSPRRRSRTRAALPPPAHPPPPCRTTHSSGQAHAVSS